MAATTHTALEPPAITHNAARSHQLFYGNKTSAPSASPPVEPASYCRGEYPHRRV